MLYIYTLYIYVLYIYTLIYIHTTIYYIYIYEVLLYYMLNSLSLRETSFDGNPMIASISYQFYKTVFRSILFLTFQQLCEVDRYCYYFPHVRNEETGSKY